ncbi:hypothetical protein [Trinickia symbiotica]|uniref:hypothetical protein n=1 Tax=Trinickia symbiotica TaxID=863227 RepID=UPI00215960F8|nr:hypothetical protein [Trinickia symbiotica]
MSSSLYEDLLEAAYALEELAAGRQPVRERLLAGALALDTLMQRGQLDRDLQDAALGLKAVATGGTLELDARGRRRAGVLAGQVRALAAHYAPVVEGAPLQLSVDCRARLYRAFWPRGASDVAVFVLAASIDDARARLKRHLSWIADEPHESIVLGHIDAYMDLVRAGASDDVDLRVFERRAPDGQATGWIEQPLFLTGDATLLRKWTALQAELAAQHVRALFGPKE